jgi:serine/threonine-protein kinase ULK/ATG1
MIQTVPKRQVASYILDKRIGSGVYAAVWKAHVKGSNKVVAIKVVNRKSAPEVAQLKDEVALLLKVAHSSSKVAHSNIVCYQDLKKTQKHFYLVLEHCSLGSLEDFLDSHGRVLEDLARRFLADIAAGLLALHHAGGLHLDLRPQNILLSKGRSHEPTLKLANLGFARTLQSHPTLGIPAAVVATKRNLGPPVYTAPEILGERPYDTRADIWSAGVVFHEMLIGRPPFVGATAEQLLASMQRSCPGFGLEGVVSPKAEELLCVLLALSPERRLSSQDLAQHSYVRFQEQYPEQYPYAFLPSCPPWATNGSLFRDAAWAAARATASAATAAATAAAELPRQAAEKVAIVSSGSLAAVASSLRAQGRDTQALGAPSVPLSPLTASSIALLLLRTRAAWQESLVGGQATPHVPVGSSLAPAIWSWHTWPLVHRRTRAIETSWRDAVDATRSRSQDAAAGEETEIVNIVC